MKYIVIVPDGMADYPIPALKGKTPLEYAQTPNMDFLAQHGLVGMIQTIPDNLPPGSDVGNLSAMGYDPRKSFSGRAPLEAANMNVALGKNDIAFRCNLVTIGDKKMADYSAGHISSKEAAALIAALNKNNKMRNVKFYPGKSYRHLTIIKSSHTKKLSQCQCTPPHDILNKKINSFFPKGANAKILNDLMEWSKGILKDHPVNKKRIAEGKSPATMIWLWGQGLKPQLPLFKKKFGITGSVISAVDLVNGIGKLIGLNVIRVPGATGYYDTNYKGKAQYALRSLKKNDFIFIHIEAPDEAGHNGDLRMKVKCIELIDKEVIGTILKRYKAGGDFRILILPDHRTPLSKRTHTREPVCFVMSGKNIQIQGSRSFSEKTAANSGIFFATGEKLMNYFIKGNG
ncbi:MAG: cofactor-independent phosphoglycerate mutase [Candidatus Omnitrophica bacterium]|nr:cofactor-independent phosphoglycerate mutase [Candidatus Omnitrophota bacterium]